MNLATLALQNSRITISGILIILVMGITSYLSYPSAEDPTITIRSASVTASYPGMSPERVEELITKPLEAAMREIAEIDEIKSTSKTGSVKIDLAIHDWVKDLDAGVSGYPQQGRMTSSRRSTSGNRRTGPNVERRSRA